MNKRIGYVGPDKQKETKIERERERGARARERENHIVHHLASDGGRIGTKG